VYSADELTRSDALSVIYAALRQRGIVAEQKGDIIILRRLEDEHLRSVPVPRETDEKVLAEFEVMAEEGEKVSQSDKLESEKLSAEGWELLRGHRPGEAEMILKEAVEKDSSNADAWGRLGRSQFDQGKLSEASASFLRCVSIKPGHAQALDGLGWIAMGEGKTDEAIAYWQKAANAATTTTQALHTLAMRYMNSAQYDKAVEFYRMWLKADPDNPLAKAGLKQAKERIAAAESGRVLKPAEEAKLDEETRKEMAARERAKIAKKLAALENHQVRLQRDLDAAEQALEEIRVRWGISDLEERSYPHPITSRLSRLQEQRDDCTVEASRLEASIEILDKKVKAADAEQKEHGFKVRLEKARDELILLRSKLERLQTMVDEAEAQKKDLDSARAQYRQRLAVRDERREMLDTIREQIEKLRIIYDDPQIAEAPAAAMDGPGRGESARQQRRLSREEIRAKLANLENQRNRMQQDLDMTERAMEDVMQRWGFRDLEERSYPHPVTARLMRLEQERDSCLVQIAQLQAEARNLEERAETAAGKANLKKVQDSLVVLTGKLEELQKMCDEAAAKKKDLDTARVQYRQRASVRDERKRMLDSLKEQIEKLRILHDDPATPEVRERPGLREDEDRATEEGEGAEH
jgi:Tfp pilus assembly protein PilF